MSSPCCGPSRQPGSADPDGTAPNASASAARPALVALPGGAFDMGTDDPRGYHEDGEGPVHPVEVSPFAVGRHTVTNAMFGEFVAASGWETTAERLSSSFVFAGSLPAAAPPTRAVAAAPWWRLVDGASWRTPEGPGSSVESRGDHPVVHVSWWDAMAFCTWSGTRLPTEAEWEYAARGGLEGVHYPWGEEREPEGRHLMNVFQGSFPDHDTAEDGYRGPCPVGSFPSNGFGLHEMTGNVWEWCADWFDPTYYARSPRQDPAGPDDGSARVMRGGSFLCHDSYCWRYRVDARSSNTPESSTSNLGFRVALTLD